MKHIFRAYDVRGIFNQELTPDIATKIGMAFGTYLKGKGKVILGRDVRTSSEIIENAIIAGLASTGLDVVSTGLVPIPVLNFKTRMGDYDAGAYITASHNPPEYNGVRLRRSDGSGYTTENQEVWGTYQKGKFKLANWNRLGKISHIDNKRSIREYKDYLLQRIKIDKSIKAVLDIGNGASFETVPQVLNEAGVKVITINETPDGTFPGRPSEPSDKTLGDLKKRVAEEGADFGAGYDGDSDRVIFVDDKGRTVQTEKIG
ncbi:MAG: phosphoglucosamine mutase, partial [Candidatus Hydrothermarchaeales archaeon]